MKKINGTNDQKNTTIQFEAGTNESPPQREEVTTNTRTPNKRAMMEKFVKRVIGSVSPALGDIPDILYPDSVTHVNRWR